MKANCVLGEIKTWKNRINASRTIYERMGYAASDIEGTYHTFTVKNDGKKLLVDSGKSTLSDLDTMHQLKKKINEFGTDGGILVSPIYRSEEDMMEMYAGANGIRIVRNAELLDLVARYMRPEINEMFCKQ